MSPAVSPALVAMCVIRRLLLPALLAVLAGPAWSQVTSSCGPLTNAFGPFDYRTAAKAQKDLVEGAHFTPLQENLIRGRSPAVNSLGGNIDYTLRVFPNHHRALVSMARFGDRLKMPRVPGADYSVECYFDRALRFQPDDVIVRMLYGRWLADQKRQADALAQLMQAKALAGDNPFTHYNLGLVLLEIGEHDAAAEQGLKALELGFARTELQDRLKALGKWPQPAAAAALPVAASGDAAPAAAASAPRVD